MIDKSKVIVLGTGFLANAYARHGYTTWGRDKFSWGFRGLHISELNDRLAENRRRSENEEQLVVINTIGVSDTRFCEDPENWDIVRSVNGDLPQWLSITCEYFDAKLVHISTGCLYDVRNKPQKETDFKAAHCNYTVSKWSGELGCNPNKHLILRPRLLFDSEAPKNGARNNLLCKFKEFQDFIVEYNTVTSLDTIVEATEALVNADQSGTFNVGQTGEYTIAGMAESLGFYIRDKLTQSEMHKSQGLYLVNNLMDMEKLQEFYRPRDTIDELKRCWDILQEN